MLLLAIGLRHGRAILLCGTKEPTAANSRNSSPRESIGHSNRTRSEVSYCGSDSGGGNRRPISVSLPQHDAPHRSHLAKLGELSEGLGRVLEGKLRRMSLGELVRLVGSLSQHRGDHNGSRAF